MPVVLVGTDFSTRSDRALRRAVLIARASDWNLHLLAVVDDDQPQTMVDSHVREAGVILEDIAATLGSHDGVHCHTEVRTGDPFMVLAHAADQIEPAVMVLGPHRRQFLRDQFRGTTVERTLRRSKYPIVVANGVPSGPYRRVIVAVDLEPYSAAGLTTALALPFAREAKHMVLYAYDPVADAMLSRSFTPAENRAAEREHLTAAALREVGEFLTRAGVQDATAVVRPSPGHPAAAIADAARSLKADLIVLTVSDKSALAKNILGSTVEAVLRDAETDVLVIHPG